MRCLIRLPVRVANLMAIYVPPTSATALEAVFMQAT
jgi:hypothetical protein